jgi:hypothetical protein
MRRSLRGRAAVVVVVVVAVAAAGGIAYASIPDTQGVIHACYSTNGATATNGTQLSIIDPARASCTKNQQSIAWSQTGPPGQDGADGQDGQDGQDGAKGDKGDPGPSDAFTNYGDGVHAIGDGLTQTVASVTVPAGSYILTGTVAAGSLDGFPEFLTCSFTGGTVHGVVALIQSDGRSAVLADSTVTGTANPIFLRCFMQGGSSTASGQIAAIHVGTVTQSE